MDKIKIRQHLIKNGVKNLHEFGYESCNETNILTDDVYSQFFRSMLNENYKVSGHPDVDAVIEELLNDVKA